MGFNWVSAGLGAYDWWQKRDTAKDVTHAQKEGYDQARKDVKEYADPYFDKGLEHYDQYDKMGEFDFQFDQDDPSYQWRLSEGLQGVQRSQAANKMLASGNTLAALNTRAQNEALQEYQAEFDRDLKSYDTSKQYHQFPMELGQKSGQFAGQYLSDLAVGIGAADAEGEAAKGAIDTGAISDVGSMFDGAAGEAINQGVSKVAEMAMEKMGFSKDQAVSWAKEQLGKLGGGGSGAAAATTAFTSLGLGAAELSTLGGVATAAFGGAGGGLAAGTGSLSASMLSPVSAAASSAFGGTSAAAAAAAETSAAGAAGAASATTGFVGGLATAAAGLGVLFAFRAGIIALRGTPQIQDTLKDLGKSKDPISDIFKLDANAMQGLMSRTSSKYGKQFGGVEGDLTSGGLRAQQRQGMMFAMIVNGMEDPSQIKFHKDANKIVSRMMQDLKSGSQSHAKLGLKADSAAALGKIYPSLKKDFAAVAAYKRAALQEKWLDDTSTDGPMGSWQSIIRKRRVADSKIAYRKSLAKINKAMGIKQQKWSAQRLIARRKAQAGGA